MAMSMLATQAPSIRWKATRFLPASITAMFIAKPISRAFCSAEDMIFLDSSSLITVLLPPKLTSTDTYHLRIIAHPGVALFAASASTCRFLLLVNPMRTMVLHVVAAL